jgi:hypothetical protein
MPYKTWNVVRAGDEYRDKDGNNKRRWNPIGTLLFNEEKNSFSLKLHIFDGWFNCFENTYDDKPKDVEPVSEETEKPKW